jgi:hypothetical protein
MYTTITDNNPLKGKHLYLVKISIDGRETTAKKIYVRSEMIYNEEQHALIGNYSLFDFGTLVKRIIYEGGYIDIPLNAITNERNNLFMVKTNYGRTVIATQKQELQRFLRKQINGKYYPYKSLYIYQKGETNTWKCQIDNLMQRLKKL